MRCSRQRKEFLPSALFFSVTQVYFVLGMFNVSRMLLPDNPSLFLLISAVVTQGTVCELCTEPPFSFVSCFYQNQPSSRELLDKVLDDFTWLFLKSNVSHSIRIFYLGNKWHFLKTISKEKQNLGINARSVSSTFILSQGVGSRAQNLGVDVDSF